VFSLSEGVLRLNRESSSDLIMLSPVMLSPVMLSPVMLSPVMLSGVEA
jgi:hypothetical protein